MNTSVKTPYAAEQQLTQFVVVNSHGHEVAQVFGDTDEEAIATAEFIVKSCNAHDELIDVLKSLVFAINEDKDGDFFICKETRGVIGKANALIAAIEGGACTSNE
jgi:hypothetical protein